MGQEKVAFLIEPEGRCGCLQKNKTLIYAVCQCPWCQYSLHWNVTLPMIVAHKIPQYFNISVSRLVGVGCTTPMRGNGAQMKLETII